MNFQNLSDVKFGDREGLSQMLFENGLQHQVFRESFSRNGFSVPAYPLTDVDIDNLDDWLIGHTDEHIAFDKILGLSSPFNLLDIDWNNESDFYDWISSHLFIHQVEAAALGINS